MFNIRNGGNMSSTDVASHTVSLKVLIYMNTGNFRSRLLTYLNNLVKCIANSVFFLFNSTTAKNGMAVCLHSMYIIMLYFDDLKNDIIFLIWRCILLNLF